MASDSLSWRLSLRLVLIVVCALGGAGAIAFVHAWIAGGLLVALAFLQVFLMSEALRSREREIARFVDAVRFSDLSQSFSERTVTAPLAAALNGALQRLRDTTALRDAETILLRALYEHAPVAVMAIGSRGELRMMNIAARRLLGTSDLASLPKDLAEALSPQAKAHRALVRTQLGGRVMRLMVASAELKSRGADIRVVSLQNIESELGGAEFDAWRDLTRVLTHEITNSLTPIASLSQLVRTLSEDSSAQKAEIAEAAQSLAARAETLLAFLASYREFTRLPPPQFAEIGVAAMLARLAKMFEGAPGSKLSVRAPSSLSIEGDAGQIEQALINLITNARESAASDTDVDLEAQEESGSVAFIVADRGSGVPDDLRERIFTPFFSTKPGGSGIGLSLARQIALAHGGTIDCQQRSGGGSVFTLTVPRKRQG